MSLSRSGSVAARRSTTSSGGPEPDASAGALPAESGGTHSPVLAAGAAGGGSPTSSKAASRSDRRGAQLQPARSSASGAGAFVAAAGDEGHSPRGAVAAAEAADQLHVATSSGGGQTGLAAHVLRALGDMLAGRSCVLGVVLWGLLMLFMMVRRSRAGGCLFLCAPCV